MKADYRDYKPLELLVAPENFSGAREFADILRLIGCACSNRIETRCGRSAAKLFASVDMEGRAFTDLTVSLGMPAQEAHAMLDLAQSEFAVILRLPLAR